VGDLGRGISIGLRAGVSVGRVTVGLLGQVVEHCVPERKTTQLSRGPGKGFHLFRPPCRIRHRPKCCLHHLVSDPAEEEGVGLFQFFDGVAMQLVVHGYGTVIAAPVQGDVDGIVSTGLPTILHY
jgi:hypothetical protein